jgi:hypothetical protein
MKTLLITAFMLLGLSNLQAQSLKETYRNSYKETYEKHMESLYPLITGEVSFSGNTMTIDIVSRANTAPTAKQLWLSFYDANSYSDRVYMKEVGEIVYVKYTITHNGKKDSYVDKVIDPTKL